MSRIKTFGPLFLCFYLFSPLSQAATINFVVAEWPGHEVHYDSFILPLSDPADIAYARDLITLGPGVIPSQAVVDIALGSDGINRNITQPGEPPWSWHVVNFVGFADITAEYMQTWPTYIESDPAGWIAGAGGKAAFAGYIVVAELGAPVPLPGAVWLFGAGLAGLAGLARRRRPGSP